MNLPWVGLQAAYAHFAWAVVLAAWGVGLLAWQKPLNRRLALGWVALAFTACALPGPAAPSYWLSLAFQMPSPLFLACAALAVRAQTQGRVGHRVMPTGLAVSLALAGVFLYADTAGWLYFGLYVRGFAGAAAFAGVLTGAAALLALSFGANRAASLAVLLSLTLYALCRLPTGNVWDAVLDPMLWLWSVCSLLARSVAWLRSTRARLRAA
jgi:hypothetical protein